MSERAEPDRGEHGGGHPGVPRDEPAPGGGLFCFSKVQIERGVWGMLEEKSDLLDAIHSVAEAPIHFIAEMVVAEGVEIARAPEHFIDARS